MLTTKQKEARKNFICGSDAAAVLGLNPWKTPYQLWCEKTSRIADDIDINEANYIKFGNYMEQGVADWFEDASGKKLKAKSEDMIIHPTIPYLAGNIDFAIDGEKAFLECKTSLSDKDWGNGENIIPLSYLIQVAHYCIVGDFEKAYLAVVFSGKREMRYYEYDRNPELEKLILEKEQYFWEKNVELDIAPEPINISDLMMLYNKTNSNPISATGEIQAKLETIRTLNKNIRNLEETQDKLKQELFLFMKDSDTLIDVYGKTIATWKFTKPIKRFNSKQFEKDNKDLYNDYIIESAPSRRFKIYEEN